MLEIYQQTIGQPVSFQGIGLHTGKKSHIKILPANEDQGIVFKRIDLNKNFEVKATYDQVSSARLCTTLENKHGVKVSTVEHLLAALFIKGIDNAIVEIDCEEVPIMDGSAKEFINVLKNIELKSLQKKRKYLKISETVKLTDGERNIYIQPSDYFEVDFNLKYENKIIGEQNNLVNFQTDNLIDIYESRTFCLYDDIEKIKKNGLAKGGSLDNAIVVDKNKILNEGGLRNENEFVNHKILDLAGDFMLSGYRVLGKVSCNQGGHQLTNMFLRKLFLTDAAFSIAEIKEIVISKKRATSQQIKLAVNA
tara:strand:- start:105 stop:1028 length:924 start_codon:yes stop_codon:yes gene_type:complete